MRVHHRARGTHLLLEEAVVNDTGRQVVHPLPFNDVVQHQLLVCWAGITPTET